MYKITHEGIRIMRVAKFKHLMSYAAILTTAGILLFAGIAFGTNINTDVSNLVISSEALLLDDFDEGPGLNSVGGKTESLQSSNGDCFIFYESDPEKILGGAGHSLRVDYNASLPSSCAEVRTELKGSDLRNYDRLSFWVKGDKAGEKFLLRLKDSAGNEGKVEIADYVDNDLSASWQKVSVPFTAFGGVPRWDSMDELYITFLPTIDPKGRIYIDNITFERTQPLLAFSNVIPNDSETSPTGQFYSSESSVGSSLSEPAFAADAAAPGLNEAPSGRYGQVEPEEIIAVWAASFGSEEDDETGESIQVKKAQAEDTPLAATAATGLASDDYSDDLFQDYYSIEGSTYNDAPEVDFLAASPPPGLPAGASSETTQIQTEPKADPPVFLAGSSSPISVFSSAGDIKAPEPPVIVFPTAHTFETGPVTFKWTAYDESGIAGYSYILTHLPDTPCDTIPEGTAAEKTYFHLTATTYYFHVAAVDNAGNWSQTSHFQITIEKVGFLLDDFNVAGPNGFGGDAAPFSNDGRGYCNISDECNPQIAFGGTGCSLMLEYNTPLPTSEAGMQLELEGGNLEYYSALSLWVKGVLGGEKFRLALTDSAGNKSTVVITDYLVDGASIYWQEVTIPFNAFGNIKNWNDMAGLFITFSSSLGPQGKIYIDDIRFEHVSTPTEPEKLTFIIDDCNDGAKGINSLGFWTGGGGPAIKSLIAGTSNVTEVYLHRYDVDKKDNNAKVLTYDVTAPNSWGFYSSNVCVNTATNPTPQDISGFDYLSFRVKREASSAGRFISNGYADCYIKILYGNYPGVETPALRGSDYFMDTDEWQLVNIPLSDFRGLDKTKARAVIFFFDNTLQVKQGTLYIDSLEFSKGYGKPESTGPVSIDKATGTLSVDGEYFAIKGVGYQPIPIGGTPPSFLNSSIFDRDFPILVDMGCNTIRTWGDPGIELMDKAGEYGLKVIAGFWIDTHWSIDYSFPPKREEVKRNFTDFVNKYKNSPALLTWALGNENNYTNGSNPAFYSLCNELAQIAYEEEGSSYHPVLIVNGSLYNIGANEMGADDLQLNYIDAWGANAYHKSFSSVNWTAIPTNWKAEDADPRDRGINFFELYTEKSSKPLIITEFGADAFFTLNPDTSEGYVDEDAQSDWVRQNVFEILGALDGVLGGCIMAYSDEWWKSNDPDGHDPGPAYWWGDNLPDGYANEEWWGIVEIAPDGTWSEPDGIDDVRVRKLYNVLSLLYGEAKVDFDRDGDVDYEDFKIFNTSWLKKKGEAGYNPACDYNNDGIVNFIDYAVFANKFKPHAEFNARFMAGAAPLTVDFTDASAGAIKDWQWKFGDGGESQEQNPSYTYNSAGSYTVTLKVVGPEGSDSVTKKDYIKVANIVILPNESIQEAVTAASSGDIILIHDGTYEGITVNKDVILVGESTCDTIIEGSIECKDANLTIENLTINGIKAVNSEISVKDCIVSGGIEIWNLCGSSDISPTIENNLIRGEIYLYSHANGGAIGGTISNNTLDGSGIVMRMYKENPAIHNNIIINAGDAIRLTYFSLYPERLGSISNNCFFGNAHNVFIEELQSENFILREPGELGWDPRVAGNIFEDPEFADPENLDYFPQNPNCSDKGFRLNF